MRYLIFAFFISIFAGSSASAQNCGCSRVVPHSGNYTVVFNEKINRPSTSKFEIVVSDVGDELGAKLKISGDGLTAELFCDGTGSYSGVLAHMNQNIILWPQGVGANWGIDLGTVFNVSIQRPTGIGAAMAEESLAKMKITLDGFQGSATPKMCSSVLGKIQQAKLLKSIHEDDTILDQALKQGIGAYSTTEGFRLNTGAKLTVPKGTTTYQDLLTDAFRNSWPTQNGNAAVLSSSIGVNAGISATAAGTDPILCGIVKPSEKSASGICRMTAHLDAIMAHENHHSNTCKSMKLKGLASEYRYWVNHPEALSIDEANAYQVSIASLQQWHTANCS